MSTLIKCLHPVRIPNPAAPGKFMFVNCGKCNACLVRRAEHWKQRLQIEESRYRFTYFVTLTYNNESLPLATYTLNGKRLTLHDITSRNYRAGKNLETTFNDDGDYFRNFYEELTEDDIKEAINKARYNTNGNINYLSTKAIPYACHRDITLFIKRLRKNIKNEKIRYYYSSEYGPQTMRPHYHICIYFNEESTQRHILHYIHKSWSFGRIDASASRSKAASYVAGYVTGYSALPSVYASMPLRPFSRHSTRFAESFHPGQIKEVYENGFEYFNKQVYQVGNKYKSLPSWRTYTLNFFPKCREYHIANDDERLDRYTILSKATQYYQESKITILADYITEDITCTNNIHGLPTFLHYWYKVYHIDLQNISDYNNNIKYKYDTRTFSVSAAVRFNNIILSALYLSNHFMNVLCKELSTSFVLRQINNYYKDLELYVLNEWYNTIEEHFQNDNVQPIDICLFYDYNRDLCNQFFDVDSDELFKYFDISNTNIYDNFKKYYSSEIKFKMKNKHLNEIHKAINNY